MIESLRSRKPKKTLGMLIHGETLLEEEDLMTQRLLVKIRVMM